MNNEKFITPLGVLPQLDDEVLEIKISNGYTVGLATPDKKYENIYSISLSNERIPTFLKTIVNEIIPSLSYAIISARKLQNGGIDKNGKIFLKVSN